MSPRTIVATLTAALACHAGSWCLATEPAAAAPPTADAILTVPIAAGSARFQISAPDAQESPAAIDEAAILLPPGRPAAWIGGYRLTSRVIVEAADEAAVLAALAQPALAPANIKLTRADAGKKPNGPLSRFFILQTASVRQAIDTAALLRADPALTRASVDLEPPRTLRSNIPTDPGVPQQWHLINQTDPLFDTGADAAWKAGFTGTGVTVAVLEGGWDITHEDLAANYDAAASQPAAGSSAHGTSTAGLIAAVAGNDRGGVGVAFGARISRLYYGSIAETAAALTFADDLNHVKSNSWGPFDNGRISQIDPLELAAIEEASINGRDGKGTVFVWAGGNGGQTNGDRVDYDPYASNRFAIALGSIDALDRRSLYSEPGSALMAVTTSDYDLASSADQGIYTTASFNGYTSTFGGTSSAAPIGAGVVALMLQANPDLTWRDVQHVLIRSARRCNPADPSWTFNGAGAGNVHRHSELFGFGALDAGAAVALAQSWVNRPPEVSLTSAPITPAAAIPDADPLGVVSSIAVTGTMLVERVQVTLYAPHPNIGHLRIVLTSPGGTQSVLAAPRSDTTIGGYNGYTFTIVRHWEERAAGTWTLRLADEVAGGTGTFSSWQLRLHGYQPVCRCDWNISGTATLQDLFDYLNSYFAAQGDFSGDGATTLQDLFDFLECWFTGCA